MQTCGNLRVKTFKKSLFVQKSPQFSQKLSASNACMLATFSMSADASSKKGHNKKILLRWRTLAQVQHIVQMFCTILLGFKNNKK